MNKSKTITLKGVSESPYTFTVYPWGELLEPVSAVYAVLKKNQHGYSIIYIGKTYDLDKHVYNHNKRFEFKEEGATHIGIHLEPAMSRRYSIEMDLIICYTPPINALKKNKVDMLYRSLKYSKTS